MWAILVYNRPVCFCRMVAVLEYIQEEERLIFCRGVFQKGRCIASVFFIKNIIKKNVIEIW